MILTIKGADFSGSGLGTNTSVSISYNGNVSGTPGFIEKNTALTSTITIKTGYTYDSISSVTVGGSAISGYTATDNGNGTVTLTIPANLITGKVVVNVNTTAVNTGGGEEDEPVTPPVEPEEPGTGGETTDEYIINFDFTQNNLNDYSLDGTFEIPANSTVSDITYGAQGMNLNNNLPNGLILTTPVDSSKAWTLEFTGTFVKPTVLTGNRRAFLGGDNLTPFVFMNGNATESISFQVSAGNHVYTDASNMIWDSEVTYKFIYNGGGSLDLYVNNELKETKTINYTGNFVRILGNIEGKSAAYIWQDVESGKQSWLKTFKFKYNN